MWLFGSVKAGQIVVPKKRLLITKSRENIPGPCRTSIARSQPQRIWSLIPDSLMSGYDVAAATFNTDKANAPNRPARPSAMRGDRYSSAAVASQAAKSGGKSATVYSFSNKDKVESQLWIFTSPDLKNTWAT